MRYLVVVVLLLRTLSANAAAVGIRCDGCYCRGIVLVLGITIVGMGCSVIALRTLLGNEWIRQRWIRQRWIHRIQQCGCAQVRPPHPSMTISQSCRRRYCCCCYRCCMTHPSFHFLDDD